METAGILLKELSVTELKSRYDQNAGYLLANKDILARILSGCVKEFKGKTPEEIIPCIEDDIRVGNVRIEPGMTNREKIRGIQREDYIPEEGTVCFDLLFMVRLPENKMIRIIINLEIENRYFPRQVLLSRSIYYPARELSAQGERDISLRNQEYDKLSKVYSIWIFMNVPGYMANTIKSIRLQENSLYGNDYRIPGSYDLMETVLIGIGRKGSEPGCLPDLLFTLLTNTLRAEEKKKILEEKYSMELTDQELERTNDMCNLSDAIEAKGLQIGHTRGLEEGRKEGKEIYRDSIIRKKLMKGQSIEEIALLLEEDLETVRKAADKIMAEDNNE